MSFTVPFLMQEYLHVQQKLLIMQSARQEKVFWVFFFISTFYSNVYSHLGWQKNLQTFILQCYT